MNNVNRTLVFKLSKRHIIASLFVPLLAGIILAIMLLLSDANQEVPLNYIILAVLGIGTPIYLYMVTRVKIIINKNSIQKITLWSKAEIPLDALSMYNYTKNEIEIYQKEQEKPAITISNTLENHAKFIEWLEQYEAHPNLKEIRGDYKAEVQEFKNKQEFGINTETKEENLKNANRVNLILLLLVIAMNMYSIVGIALTPDYFSLDLNAHFFIGLPFIFIYLLYFFKGLLKVITKRETSLYPSIGFSFIFICSTNIFWVFYNWYIHEIPKMLLYSCILAFCMTILFVAAAKDMRYKKIKSAILPYLISYVLFFGYSYGALVYINVRYDNSTAQEFSPKVLSKRTSGDVAYVTVSSWHTFTEPIELEVENYIHNKTELNDPIKISLQSGALGVEWYKIRLQE